MYIWTHAKHVWNDGAAATARAAQLDTKKLCSSPCPHHDSAPSRPHPLICTGAEPIHPVHCPPQLPAWPCRPMVPRNEVIFLPFWRGFVCKCVLQSVALCCTDDCVAVCCSVLQCVAACWHSTDSPWLYTTMYRMFTCLFRIQITVLLMCFFNKCTPNIDETVKYTEILNENPAALPCSALHVGTEEKCGDRWIITKTRAY